MFDVRILRDRGDEVISVPADHLVLMAPRKRDTVKVISGSRRGFVGKVQVSITWNVCYRCVLTRPNMVSLCWITTSLWTAMCTRCPKWPVYRIS